MDKFYDINAISDILKKFNVKKIVVSGLKNEKLMDLILNYGADVTQINSGENPLNILLTFKDYDAIFIDDDPNWYTIFNELNIINETLENFPLVFICNNKFPNKTRDAYLNPNVIPKEFRHDYTDKLPICHGDKKIIISDGLYHAKKENTPKNGVLTGIIDFLSENNHVGKMNIKFIEDITVLYLKIQINQKRIKSLIKYNKDNKIDGIDITDKLQENYLLISHIDKYNLYNDKFSEIEAEMNKNKTIIVDFKNQIHSQINELKYNKSHIDNIESKLDLKDSKIQNIESILMNKKHENINLKKDIINIEDKLKQANNTIEQQKSDLNNIKQKENKLSDEITEYKLKESNYEIKLNDFNKKEHYYEDILLKKNNEVDLLKNNLAQKENEYTNKIYDFNKKERYYEDILLKKNNEVDLLKNNLAQKDVEFNSKEIELIKKINSKNLNIQEKDNELENKQYEFNSLKQHYNKQLSKIDKDEYFISCFKTELSNKDLEINYLKDNIFIKKILSPLAYLYLIFKSKPKDMALNLNLYKILKNSDCFDIGFYLNNNKDLVESRWCKYFSPELHYVCRGFLENRKFNKKYFDKSSKEELLKYLQNCEK